MSDKQKMIEILEIIIADCKQDVVDFEGKELNGRTVAEIHGILEAKIEALAKIIKELLEENQ